MGKLICVLKGDNCVSERTKHTLQFNKVHIFHNHVLTNLNDSNRFNTYPALATLMVCCSIASWILVLSCSLRLLNSSIQQRPASASTNAPASKFHSPESFTAVTVRPKETSRLCQLLFSKAYLIPMKGNKYLHFKEQEGYRIKAFICTPRMDGIRTIISGCY